MSAYLRSDKGTEFIAQAARDWIVAVGDKTAYNEPASPWENGSCESFNAQMRDEMLNGEVFYTLREAEILIEKWRKHRTTKPCSSHATAKTGLILYSCLTRRSSTSSPCC